MDNLTLKPQESKLDPPGISFLQASSPAEAARRLRKAFPLANDLHDAAQVISSTTLDKIRNAGFDAIPNPTRNLPNHFRVIHKDGIAGFVDTNLIRLWSALTETSALLP